jgi:hypothetical protein
MHCIFVARKRELIYLLMSDFRFVDIRPKPIYEWLGLKSTNDC